jgi:hypothetical protein
MRKLGVWACGVALVLGTGSAAVAQEAPIPPARLALAQQVVEANGTKAIAARMIDAMAAQMSKGLLAGAGASDTAAFVARVMREELAAMQAKMDPLYAPIYARTFDDQQLNDLLTFYRSPTGQMLVAKSPELQRQSQLVILPLIPQMQRDMVIKIFDHVCETNPCTPEQRQKLSVVEASTLDRIAHPAQTPVQP